MDSPFFQIAGTTFFAIALLHTFLVGRIRSVSRIFAENAFLSRVCHLWCEVELIFGFWAAAFIGLLTPTLGISETFRFLSNLHFKEPIFVFATLILSATRPILRVASFTIEWSAKWLPFDNGIAFALVTLTVGPLLGSFITEPAAMTVTALLLLDRYFTSSVSVGCKISLMALLFVNVSIGGTLTPFAAPPVLLVASSWDWNFIFMLKTFGYKAVIACALSTAAIVSFYRDELAQVTRDRPVRPFCAREFLMVVVHFIFLLAVVINAGRPPALILIVLLFVGFWRATRKLPDTLAWERAAGIGVFLCGVVILGKPQSWWLGPLLAKLSVLPLYLGSLGLTAIVDNAALTYLGLQVNDLSLSSRYSLVAGAVVGGGLSVIANAPNPIGFAILGPSIKENGVNALQLLLAAVVPTAIAGLCFWFLP